MEGEHTSPLLWNLETLKQKEDCFSRVQNSLCFCENSKCYYLPQVAWQESMGNYGEQNLELSYSSEKLVVYKPFPQSPKTHALISDHQLSVLIAFAFRPWVKSKISLWFFL